ncbi:MAG TPA: phosphodiester glycosidase family protein [Candidatus Nanopelagicaceae bacterium]|jgi:hypothetical protein
MSVMRAVTSPNNDPISAKLAEWGRDHGLGSVVTGLESLQYRLNPPQIGGTPNAIALGSRGNSNSAVSNGGLGLQKPIAAIVVPELKNEGRYRSILSVHGHSVLQIAYLRPDSLHTSYLSAVIWMSGKHTRLSQHPGQSDPGHLSLWSQPTSLSKSASTGLLAAFNGGFKIRDSRGGFFENGHTYGVLQRGAASLVVYHDGNSNIGVWGRDVRMDPHVVSVRQNLRLLVDGGRLAANLDAAVRADWGITVGSTTDVWRSGIGITSTGDLVYVVGDALSARSLASLLQRAGAIRAMQLDINKTWVSFMWFTPSRNSKTLSPQKVLNFQRPANRYFFPTSRDFFAVYYK